MMTSRSLRCLALLLCGLFTFAPLLEAAIGRYAVAVQLPVEGKSKPTPAEEDALVAALKSALLSKVISVQEPSRRAKLSVLFPTLNPDAFIVPGSLLIMKKEYDRKAKLYQASAQADIDAALFNPLIDGERSAVPAGKKPRIAWVFAARRQSAVRENELRVVNARENLTVSGKEASENNSGGLASQQLATREKASSETKGFVEKTSDAITYDIENNQKGAIDGAMSEVFKNRDIPSTPVSSVVSKSKGRFNPDRLQEDFRRGSQLSNDNQALAEEVCRDIRLDMLAYGTLTIGIKERDPATNNVRVTVTIDAQVYDYRDSFAEVVASIGARQVTAFGINQTEAETKAIQLAATEAANVIADQLRSKVLQ